MSVDAILALVAKGLALLPAMIDAGEKVHDFIARLRAVAAKQAAGETVSDAEIEALEAEIDAGLERFNAPLPDDV